MNASGRVLLIADDEHAGRHYRGALEAAGYHVTQTETFVNVLGNHMPDPDVIVLCDLAVLAYPGQEAPVIRVHKMTPDELVIEVHRRLVLRPTLLAAAQPV
ncbi:MAG TPA: hypothetical protein VE951_04425 [Candidatus Angelobacter sp.]|nr:hypothetical protein [Candidatus Angelobacter sp.]